MIDWLNPTPEMLAGLQAGRDAIAEAFRAGFLAGLDAAEIAAQDVAVETARIAAMCVVTHPEFIRGKVCGAKESVDAVRALTPPGSGEEDR